MAILEGENTQKIFLKKCSLHKKKIVNEKIQNFWSLQLILYPVNFKKT